MRPAHLFSKSTTHLQVMHQEGGLIDSTTGSYSYVCVPWSQRLDTWASGNETTIVRVPKAAMTIGHNCRSCDPVLICCNMGCIVRYPLAAPCLSHRECLRIGIAARLINCPGLRFGLVCHLGDSVSQLKLAASFENPLCHPLPLRDSSTFKDLQDNQAHLNTCKLTWVAPNERQGSVTKQRMVAALSDGTWKWPNGGLRHERMSSQRYSRFPGKPACKTKRWQTWLPVL